MKVDEKVIFIEFRIENVVSAGLTKGKTYIVNKNSDDFTYVTNDDGEKIGYGIHSYIFEAISDHRRKKLEKLNSL